MSGPSCRLFRSYSQTSYRMGQQKQFLSFAHLHNLLLEGFLSGFHHHSHHQRSGKSSNSIRSPGNDAEKYCSLKIMNTIYSGLTMSSLLTILFNLLNLHSQSLKQVLINLRCIQNKPLWQVVIFFSLSLMSLGSSWHQT